MLNNLHTSNTSESLCPGDQHVLRHLPEYGQIYSVERCVAHSLYDMCRVAAHTTRQLQHIYSARGKTDSHLHNSVSICTFKSG